MWEDKILYWAWRGGPDGYCNPPTEKRIAYAEITYPPTADGKQTVKRIAATVFDDDVPREVCREEIDWHRRNGAQVLMPEGGR